MGATRTVANGRKVTEIDSRSVHDRPGVEVQYSPHSCYVLGAILNLVL